MPIIEFQSPFLSGTMLHTNTDLLDLQSSLNCPFQPLSKTFHSVTHHITLTHPNLAMAVTAASHPPPPFTMSHRHANFHTVFTLLLLIIDYIAFRPNPLLFQYSLHISYKLNFQKTFRSPYSLRHIHHGSTYHIVHTELS